MPAKSRTKCTIGGRFSGTFESQGRASINLVADQVGEGEEEIMIERGAVAIADYQKPPKPDELMRKAREGVISSHESKLVSTPSQVASQIKAIQNRSKLAIPLPHGVQGNWSAAAETALHIWLTEPTKDFIRNSTSQPQPPPSRKTSTSSSKSSTSSDSSTPDDPMSHEEQDLDRK